mmetsp:Transcript_50764/g.110516  ORF Transcript_50764/g.110516 Transcript_50764/m.110516 type:complete len:252 (+) Transcript_50764:373-1128(+)
MVLVFVVFSSPRISVAVDCSLRSSEIASASSLSCTVSSPLWAVFLSMVPDSSSTSEDLMSRVCLLVAISVSQKPSWLASSSASFIRRVIMESIMDFTLAKGSAVSFWARSARPLLWRRSLSDSRKLRTWRRGLSTATCSRAADFWVWARERCFSALPETSPEDRISMALPMASISSVRSCCFSAKDIFFSSHSTVISCRVFSLSALMSMVAASCFLFSAVFSILRSFSAVFSSMSLVEFSMESVRSSTIML